MSTDIEQSKSSVANNLPTKVEPFVNRERELAEVSHALLDPDIPIVTVTGMAGVGKTALALEVAHRLLEQGQFPGGICWLDCPGKDNSLDAIMRTIQRTFDLAPMPITRDEARRYLRTNPCLLVLDGYDAVAQDMEILAFLERLPEPSKALLTSREAIRLRRSWTLALDGLATQDAVRLFVETAERYGFEVPPEQTPLITELCQILDGYPLAILLVAAQAKSEGISLSALKQHIAEWLRAPDLELVFRASYERLSEEAKVLLRRLAVFAADVDDKAIENVCQVEGWQAALSELLRFSFVREQVGRYSLLPAVRAFALQLLDAQEREEYEERAAGYFLSLAQFAEGKLNTDEAHIGVTIAQNERANMLAGQEWYWGHECWEEVIAYGYALDRLLDVAGFWEDRLTVLQRAIEASKWKVDVREEARLLHNLAVVYQEQGDYEAARHLYEQSLDINRRLGHKAGEASSLHNLGALAQAQGDYAAARRYYQQSLEIAQTLGDRAGVSRSLHQLGNIAYLQGDYAVARQLYEESLAIKEELGDQQGIASTLDQLGRLAQLSGEYDKARRYYEQVIAISERLGDIHSLGITFGNLATIFESQGEPKQALSYLERSAELFRRLGDVPNLVVTQRALARIRQRIGDLEPSIEHLSQALVLSLTLAPRPVLETAREVVDFGKTLIAQEKFADALTMVSRLGDVLNNLVAETSEKEALSERQQVLGESAPTHRPSFRYNAEAIQAATLLKDMLSVIASVASVRMDGSPPAQYEQALQALELARQVDKATGGVFELTQWVREASGYEFVELEEAEKWPPRLAYLVQLAARYEQDENWAAAIDAYRQAHALLDPNKGKDELKRHTEIGFRLGLCLKQDGRWSEALKQQEENVAGYKKLGNLCGKANAYLEMGHIYQMMNIYDLALLYYGEAYYLYQQAANEATDEAARKLARRGMANAKESLGDLEFQLKVLPKAFTDLEEAQELYTALGMPGKAAIIRQTLENAQVSTGDSHD